MAVTAAPVASAGTVAGAGSARSVQWGAVILGALGASAISIVLLAFGAGIGLSATSVHPYAGASAKALAVISALYGAVVMVASFAAGGYVAGRMRLPPTAEEVSEADFRDGAHGFAVWALAIAVGGVLAASGISGLLKTGVEAAATVGGGAAVGAATNPALGQAATRVSMTPNDYAIDRLMAPGATSPAAAPGSGPSVQSRADLAAPMVRTFAAGLRSGQLEAKDRGMLVQLVMQQTGLPQTEAEKRVDDAFTELKAAEEKARDAADRARKAALISAFALAATLLLGCAAACAGASAGARHRHERTAITLFGSRRFW
jgi:hypothetical protein